MLTVVGGSASIVQIITVISGIQSAPDKKPHNLISERKSIFIYLAASDFKLQVSHVVI